VSKDESVEVKAETVETEIASVGAIEKIANRISEVVAEKLSDYGTPQEVTDAKSAANLREARKYLRRDIDELEAQRKLITNQLDDAKSRIMGAMKPLKQLDIDYKAALDAWDNAQKLERKAALAQEYEDFAPMLCELVPFDRLLQAYGQEKGKNWMLRGTPLEKAVADMQERVMEIGKGEETIDALFADPIEREEVKADYFSTLDLQGAQARALERRAQRERVKALEEERQQAQADPEIEALAATEEPYDEPEPEPQPDYSPEQLETATPWVIQIQAATKSQMAAAGRSLRELGITGTACKGTIEEVFGRSHQ
jgi:hypothetical protein